MTSRELENLVEIGQLKRAPVNDSEIAGLVRSAEARLKDAANMVLSLESRFDLAYNAAHALALAALRRQGYRSDKRYTVFQTLPHTLGSPAPTWRLLTKCHGLRNQWEYEGTVDLDERLVTDLISAVEGVRDALRRQRPPWGE
jgi:hypothetical protein